MHLSRKIKIGIACLIALLAVGGAAWAYFTTTGSGTIAGNVGTSSALTIHGTAATTLYPGTSSTVTFTVDNTSSGHQYVTDIVLDSVSTPAGCLAADFTMPTVHANQDIPAGSGIAITATGTLTMANTAVSQDACKNAALTLNLSSN